MVFPFGGYENENHICTNAEARAIQWTYVHLDACLPSFWHRGNEILINLNSFQKPAIASQSRVFCFFDAKPKRKEIHEQKQNKSADEIRP